MGGSTVPTVSANIWIVDITVFDEFDEGILKKHLSFLNT